MTPEELTQLQRSLPRSEAFHYYRDRESAWLLSRLMPESAPVAELRKQPFGKLIERPSLSAVVARCGGCLRRRDVEAVAEAEHAMHLPNLGPAGLAGVEQVFSQDWHDFQITFDTWGTGHNYWDQTTRQQGNLVIQIGFPSDHAVLMGRYLATGARKTYEFPGHPIRLKGRPTLAWVRLDTDPATGEVLIEEVQSDWLRFTREEVEAFRERAPRSRQLAQLERYEAALVARYDRIWSRAALLAALIVVRDRMFVRRVWMHQPGPGAILKRIEGTPPPRSLYSTLPKAFCFAPTRDRPAFLRHLPGRMTKRLPKDGPLFWRLDFD